MVNEASGNTMRFSSKEELALLLQRHEPLYAVLDAARGPHVLKLVRASSDDARSLYNGRRGEQLAAVAPYLVRMPTGSRQMNEFLREGWGQSWGVLVACDSPLDDLRRHLRRFLVVQTEEGQALCFRFYDPRILAPFLNTVTEEERRAFFGPMSAFLMEGQSEGALLRWLPAGAPTMQPKAPWDLLTIRDAQMTVFAQSLFERFVDRMGKTIRLRSNACSNRAVLCEEIERARRHGIVSERGVERYLRITSVLGSRFDLRVPWARAVLLHGGTDERRKLRRLECRLRRAGSRAPLPADQAQLKDS
ncbi:DUF4123 domain-containing protein [Sorangium sp. So ce388]|uniref:DUF4123 domain-containing protein n=1 Tax=Sorangium sp. So ce388 TaxID=3133309 RepID=UPI003F5BB451